MSKAAARASKPSKSTESRPTFANVGDKVAVSSCGDVEAVRRVATITHYKTRSKVTLTNAQEFDDHGHSWDRTGWGSSYARKATPSDVELFERKVLARQIADVVRGGKLVMLSKTSLREVLRLLTSPAADLPSETDNASSDETFE
jgi:hypothetical protein